MKTQSSSKKTIISAIIIIGAVAVTIYALSHNVSAPEALLQTSSTPDADAASSRILNLLNQIRSLKIDTKVLQSEVYQSLKDYSVEIPPVNVGRPNPFAPISGFSETPATNSR